MRRRVAALLVLLALAGARRGAEARVDVQVPAGPVEFGCAFPLAVVRTWPAGSAAPPFDDAVLQPLAVVRLGRSTRTRGDQVEETLRYRAYAFEREVVEVTVDAARPLRLTVRPALPEGDPGAPELPGDLRYPPAGLPLAAIGVLLLAVLLLAAAAVARRRRRRPAAADSGSVGGSAHARASRRLARLASRAAASPVEVRADVLEAVELVRDFLADGLAVPAPARSTEELLGTPGVRRLPEREQAALAELLGEGDRAKFARHAPGADARERALARAGELLAGHAPGAPS